MDLIEASNLSSSEEFDHWWVVTRFRYVEQVLALAASREEALSVIEFGCGTGQNLRFCRELSQFRHQIARVCGVDPGLATSDHHDWMQSGDHMGPDASSDAAYDVLLAMDVLEHIQNDTEALSRWLTYVKPGGHVLITVPASQWLWSYHDERLGHVRRHTRSTVERLAAGCDLERIRARYAFGHIFPIATIVRKFIKPTTGSTDLRRHSAPVNWLLKRMGQVEAWSGGNPWGGTSVIGVFRKT
jgi:2-polyprenyl-3-methyl-5-hydroxy-6-metoxy-1,4-benzoquinol methylase